jgi:hypothetical protein
VLNFIVSLERPRGILLNNLRWRVFCQIRPLPPPSPTPLLPTARSLVVSWVLPAPVPPLWYVDIFTRYSRDELYRTVSLRPFKQPTTNQFPLGCWMVLWRTLSGGWDSGASGGWVAWCQPLRASYITRSHYLNLFCFSIFSYAIQPLFCHGSNTGVFLASQL